MIHVKILGRILLTLLFLFGVFVPETIAAEKMAADFTLPRLDGESFTLSSLQGEIVILKLGTTWCASCNEQSREIASLAPFLKGKKVQVVEVYLQDTPEAVRRIQGEETRDYSQMIVMDDGRVQRLYSVYAIPRVLLLNRSLQIVRDGSLMRGEALKELLAQIP